MQKQHILGMGLTTLRLCLLLQLALHLGAIAIAGAVIMESSLEKVDEFLHISKRMRTIALQSALGGMTLSILGMIVAAFGLSPVAGAISQEIIDVITIMNSLRTIWKPNVMTDMPLIKTKTLTN
jgi:hypothetical protein